jgi:Retrotransposon gag protein
MAAQLQQALIAHDRVRRTTDIPLFYGRKGKDTITPQQLVFRLEKASRVAGWDALANPDQRKTDEFYLSLRDNALQWYNTLDNIIGFNKENWNDLKTKFLEAYAPKYSAKALCICFQDLRQKSEENVQDFYNRVSETFRNAYETKPDHTVTYAGNLHGSTQAQCNEIMLQGVNRMQLLMLNTVFLGGLREDIRTRVLEEGPTQPDDSVKNAREIESILNDKRRERGFHVTSIEGPPEGEEAEDVGEVDEEEAAQLREVNAILRKRGRPQYRFRVRPQRGQQRGSYGTGANGSYNGTGAIVCFFCNKPGHRIAQCRDNPATKRGRGRGRRRVAAIEEVANGQDSNNSLNY